MSPGIMEVKLIIKVSTARSFGFQTDNLHLCRMDRDISLKYVPKVKTVPLIKLVKFLSPAILQTWTLIRTHQRPHSISFTTSHKQVRDPQCIKQIAGSLQFNIAQSTIRLELPGNDLISNDSLGLQHCKQWIAVSDPLCLQNKRDTTVTDNTLSYH